MEYSNIFNNKALQSFLIKNRKYISQSLNTFNI